MTIILSNVHNNFNALIADVFGGLEYEKEDGLTGVDESGDHWIQSEIDDCDICEKTRGLTSSGWICRDTGQSACPRHIVLMDWPRIGRVTTLSNDNTIGPGSYIHDRY